MVLDKLVIFLVAPLGTALCAAMLSLLLLWLGRRQLAAGLGVFVVAWLFLWSLPPVAASLARLVEAPWQALALDDIPAASVIVVLGGGINPSGKGEETGQTIQFGEAGERVWYGARLYKAEKAPIILFTGSSARRSDPFSDAVAMAILAGDLGVPESAMMVESSSRNTRENARFSARMLKSNQVNDIVLVTSAAHMARAVYHFEAEGLVVFPAPTDFAATRMERKFCCLPDGEALVASGQLVKELVGQRVWQ